MYILVDIAQHRRSNNTSVTIPYTLGRVNFQKKIYAPGPKAGFWSKKCPQKAGELYAQFSPSEIWVIVLTKILINVVTIAQISEGENWA